MGTISVTEAEATTIEKLLPSRETLAFINVANVAVNLAIAVNAATISSTAYASANQLPLPAATTVRALSARTRRRPSRSGEGSASVRVFLLGNTHTPLGVSGRWSPASPLAYRLLRPRRHRRRTRRR